MIFEDVNIEVVYRPVKSLRMAVYPDMRVRLTAPPDTTGEEIDSFVKSHRRWLHNALKRKEERLKEKAEQPVLTPLEQLIEDQKKYQSLMSYLKPRFEYWRVKMSLPPVSFSIRRMTTRWGSCTSKRRTIRFNLDLAGKPERLIDYIIVHELAHINHPNHGPSFKATLDFYMPDWRERQKELKYGK